MCVSLLPAPSLSFLGQEQACGLLCPIWPLASLKAVNVPGAHSALPDWLGPGHLLAEEEEGGKWLAIWPQQACRIFPATDGKA